MGGHATHADAVYWPEACEEYFIELLIDLVQVHSTGSPVFKACDWQLIAAAILTAHGISFTHDKLKSKYQRLKGQYEKCCELLNRTGVTFKEETGEIYAPDYKHKFFKTLKNKGCKQFNLMKIIFSGSTAIGVFGTPSTATALSSSEDRRVHEAYYGGSQAHTRVEEQTTEDAGARSRGKRPLEATTESSAPRANVRRRSISRDESRYFDNISESMTVQTQLNKDLLTSLQKANKQDEADSPVKSKVENQITECMKILDEVDPRHTALHC